MNNEKKFLLLNEKLNIDMVPKFRQIKIETTNICGCRCFMCPRLKMTRLKGTMSIDDLNLVLDRFENVKYEVEFHMHGYGESLICNNFPERLKLVNKKKPNFIPVIFTTLAYDLDNTWLESLFKNGLSKMIVSVYGYDKETYKTIHGIDGFEYMQKNLEFISLLKNKYNFDLIVQLDDFKNQYKLPNNYSYKQVCILKEQFIKYLQTLNINNISFQSLHNFGNGFECLGEVRKNVPCSIIWGRRKREISILWNLDVCPCSYDYNGSVIFGNLREQTLEEIYKSEKRLSFIKELLNLRNTSISLCSNTAGCFPQENGYNEEFEIIKKYMEDIR